METNDKALDDLKRELELALSREATIASFARTWQIDADIITAVEAYCQPENISRVIHEAARAALDNAIREEVKAFFGYGEGRKAVAEAVKDTLLKRETHTPLDEV